MESANISEFSIVSENRLTKVPHDTPTVLIWCSLIALIIIDNDVI